MLRRLLVMVLAAMMAVISSADAVALSAVEFNQPDPAASSVASGANDFAFRLSAALAEKGESANFICSPYSVWIPLASLGNATNEKHKPALIEALGAAGVSQADINRAASRMLYDLTRQGDKQFAEENNEAYHDPLKIANAIFVGNDVTLKKEFAQIFAESYLGNAMNVDFSSPSSADAINQWASEHTEGMIPHIIDAFDPATVAAAASAIYFSDRWDWEFDKMETRKDVFHASNAETEALYMLREGDRINYYEDNDMQAVSLPFRCGGGMYIMLPKEGGAGDLLSNMTNAYFDEILHGTGIRSGKLLLPRFSIDNDPIELGDTLTALGVPLFDAQNAPLTGGLIEEDMAVSLSAVIHKAVIEVDERGTTATAVTTIPMAGSAPLEPTTPFEMICNHPFVFVLYDHTFDGGAQVLFTGIVNRP